MGDLLLIEIKREGKSKAEKEKKQVHYKIDACNIKKHPYIRNSLQKERNESKPDTLIIWSVSFKKEQNVKS